MSAPPPPSSGLDDVRLVAALQRAASARSARGRPRVRGATFDRVVDRTGRVWLAVAATEVRRACSRRRSAPPSGAPERGWRRGTRAGSRRERVPRSSWSAATSARASLVAWRPWPRMLAHRSAVRSGGREHDLAQLESISGRAAGAGLAALPEGARSRVTTWLAASSVSTSAWDTEGPHERTWSLDGRL